MHFPKRELLSLSQSSVPPSPLPAMPCLVLGGGAAPRTPCRPWPFLWSATVVDSEPARKHVCVSYRDSAEKLRLGAAMPVSRRNK